MPSDNFQVLVEDDFVGHVIRITIERSSPVEGAEIYGMILEAKDCGEGGSTNMLRQIA